MSTERIESGGIDTESALTPEGCAMIRKALTTMRQFEQQGGASGSGPAEQLLRRAVTMLWGADVLSIPPDEDGLAAPDEHCYGKVPDDVKAVQPGITTMSLKGLRDTGRCSADELVRMSIASPRDRRLFIKSRAPIPAGTFPDGIAKAEAHAEQVANWAMGKGRKPS